MNIHSIPIRPSRPPLSLQGRRGTASRSFPATLCALICLAFALAVAGCSKPVELKPKMIVGKKLLVSTTTEQTAETTREGATNTTTLPANMKVESSQHLEWLVSILSESEGGGRELELELSAVQISSKAGDRTSVTFDSLADQPNVATNYSAQVYRKLIGAKLGVGTDAAFAVTKSPPLAEFIPVIPVSAPAPPSPALQRVLARQRLAGGLVTNLISQNSLNETLAPTISGLPTKPVRPGDSWAARHDTLLPDSPSGKAATDLKYTFKKWESSGGHNCALIEFTGTTTVPDLSSVFGELPSTLGEAAPRISLKVEAGELRGKAWFDPELGMFRQVVTEQTVTRSMTMPGLRGAPERTTTTQRHVKTTMNVAETSGGAPR